MAVSSQDPESSATEGCFYALNEPVRRPLHLRVVVIILRNLFFSEGGNLIHITHLRSTALKDSAAVLTTLKDRGRNLSIAARIPSEPKSISERNLRPTLNKASLGHGWNQSVVGMEEIGNSDSMTHCAERGTYKEHEVQVRSMTHTPGMTHVRVAHVYTRRYLKGQ